MNVPRAAVTALSLAAIIASCFISYQPSNAQDKPLDPLDVTSRPSASAPTSGSSRPAVGREGWQLVWFDEFDHEGLPDPKKWTYEVGFVRNQEKQYYTQARKENARVEHGELVIECRKEHFPNAQYDPKADGNWQKDRKNADYTSASITTEGKASWTYGRIEVRAKLPQGKGVWPAIWTLGTSCSKVGWPRCGEIDIMEFVGHQPDKVYGTVHYGPDGKHQSQGDKLTVDKPWEDFHVYAIQWEADRIDFFFDDTKYFTFKTAAAGSDGSNAFRQPHYLLLNLALGGSWGGQIDDSLLPQQFVVNYVRVYQRPGAATIAHNATTRPADIDWTQARQLLQEEQSGQQLTPNQKAYLDKAKAEVRAGRGPGVAGRPGQGEPGNVAAPATQQTKTGMIPLCDMTAKDSYKGEDGGLYGKGDNTPPKEQMDAAKKALVKIQPLGKDGKPAADGKIVLISVGMSNTTNEFSVFKPMADKDPDKDSRLVIVDCAQGGQTAIRWAQPDGKVWGEAEQRLNRADVSPKQVQVVWLKQAEAMPAKYGVFPKHAQQLKDNLIKDVQLIKEHYPNVQAVYLSSRIYAGYASTSLNPEPYAYEGAFAVRWLIQDQIKGSKDLNLDPAKGEVKAPVLLWGPYLWADGVAGRKSDKLVWNVEDLGGDGTHPNSSGREKVARLLLDFFKKDPAAGSWFVKPGSTVSTQHVTQ